MVWSTTRVPPRAATRCGARRWHASPARSITSTTEAATATGGTPRCITANLDLAVGDGVISDMRAGHGVPMCWSRDGDRVYFPASGPGATAIYSVDLEGNVRAEVAGQRRIYDFDVSGGV